MKTNFHFYLIWLITLIIGISCEDILVRDISKRTVNILSPTDNYVTNTLTQTFWWDEVKDAEQYRLQIVWPSFSSIQTLILDTLLTSNKFTFSLPRPGSYEWRVKAINNGSETNYFSHKLTVDSTLDLSTQVVVLFQPSDNFVSNGATFSFKWNSLYNATAYRFGISNSITGLVIDTTVTTNYLSLSLDTGEFIWKVRAENLISVSPYSQRLLTIDRESPQPSLQVSPQLAETLSSPLTLSWRRYSGTVFDSLFVYSDTSLTTLTVQIAIADTFFEVTGTSFHKYFWRLKSVDAASNVSEYSSTYNYFVQ